MSTNTQNAHWDYTIDEWATQHYRDCMDIIFQDNDIKVIYDIGANTGATTSIFLKYCADTISKIYCFEPESHNMNFLKIKLDTHIHDGIVIPIQKGIYYGRTFARSYGIGHNSLNKINDNVGGLGIDEVVTEIVSIRNDRGEDVFCGPLEGMDEIFELDTLENLCTHSPDFVKIDVEGAEKNILLNSTLIQKAKYLLVEWNQNVPIETCLPNFEIIKLGRGDILLRNKNQ